MARATGLATDWQPAIQEGIGEAMKYQGQSGSKLPR